MNSLPKTTRNLVLYFQVHQPRRLRSMGFFGIGSGAPYFDDELNEKILRRVASQCYLPANQLLLKLIKRHPEFKVAFSISGTTLDQFEEYTPEVLLSFRDLAATGSVEFLSETYYHSLACIIPGDEFEVQVLKHSNKINKYFGVQPAVFRNTGLIYNNDIGCRVSSLGFNGIISDGIERILCSRSPHHIYSHPDHEETKILLRNYRLSDDIASRSQGSSVDQCVWRLNSIPENEPVVTLALDYETFGEHQKRETGIFKFLEDLLSTLATDGNYSMMTPSEAIESIDHHSQLFVPNFISWADHEHDLSAWLGNEMQRDALNSLKKLQENIKRINDPEFLHTWRHLQTSDHFYYMCTKKENDGYIHSYFSPYCSPFEAFINYINVLSDFELKIKNQVLKVRTKTKRVLHEIN